MSLIILGCLAAAALVGPFPIRLAAGKRISSVLIKHKFSYNLVMVGSSGLGGTISNQVECWQTNLKLPYITKTHQKVATQLPKPNLISSRHTKGENSTEADTKTSKHKEPNQKYRLGTVSNILYYWGA